LHLAARIRDPARAPAILARALPLLPGAQTIDDYAIAPLPRPAITFGYGVIDAAEIGVALRRVRRALESL